MIHIEIAEGIQPEFELDFLEKAVQEVLRHEHAAEDADVTLMLTGDEQIQELNRQFLEIDEPTDVLSFPADFVDPDNQHTYLGDVILSLPRARAQAQTGAHPVEDELKLLVVHGMLHLLGYDHADPTGKDEMWAVQKDILESLGTTISPSE
jgi:probable rRNA maturation factor